MKRLPMALFTTLPLLGCPGCELKNAEPSSQAEHKEEQRAAEDIETARVVFAELVEKRRGPRPLDSDRSPGLIPGVGQAGAKNETTPGGSD